MLQIQKIKCRLGFNLANIKKKFVSYLLKLSFVLYLIRNDLGNTN